METLQKKSLFWDVDALSTDKDADFIIARVLSFGDTDDFEWVMHFYGRDKVEEVLRDHAHLDQKSFSFWCQFFKIDPSTCTKKQSVYQPTAFSQR